jgi:hypothetical protein
MDLMTFPTQTPKHRFGFLHILWFPQQLPFDFDDGIAAYHEVLGVMIGHRIGLVTGELAGLFAGREIWCERFFAGWRDNTKWQSQ